MLAAADTALRGAMRWLPQTLFHRLLLVLAGGLVLAQLLSAGLGLAEREDVLQLAVGRQQAQRIADVVSLIDSLGPQERERVLSVLSVPPLVVTLHDDPAAAPAEAEAGNGGPHAMMVEALLRASLGSERAILLQTDAAPGNVRIVGGDRAARPRDGGMMVGPGMMGAPGHMAGGGWPPGTRLLRVQVQLRDGRWARFDAAPSATAAAPPWRLMSSLAVLLAATLGLSYVAVRWITRPLHQMAVAADRLGRNLNVQPMDESGPLEIRQAAAAFNTMQARLTRFVEDRTQMLAAMSHDLKTPLTRMRLRAELLDDEELRERFESDLGEMQAMVQDALDFMRGVHAQAPAQPVDVDAMLAALQTDQQAAGRSVRVEGRTIGPYVGVESQLRRCLTNLVDNAVSYGGEATVRIDDNAERLVLRVLDPGPGIPQGDLERVFEPFHRLEPSRSRATGGTGLGLTIARDIARAHGGEIVLRNRPEGGLEGTVTLPRTAAAG
jgi:signal transduction histidine kinase